MTSYLRVRGAREHNLKNIDVDIPRDKLVVITGLSGSGKSSLAFDTIYAEGQRRYVESLSAYARQFLELMSKPDVDLIEGLSPAISIEQKTTVEESPVGRSVRSPKYTTICACCSPGSAIHTRRPPVCRSKARRFPRWSIASWPCRKARVSCCWRRIVRGRKGEYRKDLLDLQKKGFQRVKVDGQLHEIDEVPALNKKIKHDIEVVVDRIVVKDGLAARLADSFETALDLADGPRHYRRCRQRHTHDIFGQFACPGVGFHD